MRICIQLALVLVLASAASVGAAVSSLPQLSVVDGLLTVQQTLAHDFGSGFRAEVGPFLGIMNGHRNLWVVGESGTIIIDLDRFERVIANEELSRSLNVSTVRSLAVMYNGKQVTDEKTDMAVLRTLTPYYDDWLVSSGSYYSEKNTAETDWLRGPGTVGLTRGWTYSWTWSSGAGGGVPSTYIAWLQCDPSFGYTKSATYSWPVAAGQEGRGMREDNYYHTWAT